MLNYYSRYFYKNELKFDVQSDDLLNRKHEVLSFPVFSIFFCTV